VSHIVNIDIDQIGQAVLALVMIGGYIASRMTRRKVDEVKGAVAEVHVLVNSQKVELEERIRDLETKLSLAPGEPIPPQQTVTTETPRAEPPPADEPPADEPA
jgi:hypothetical protein